MASVTQILSQIEAGHASNEDLLAVVYGELRQMARRKMANERRGHTLQPTALVHEAWLRLGGAKQTRWENRRHFFGAAAEAMRRILVDHARRRRAEKRGGGSRPIELDDSTLEIDATPDELLAVHDSLVKLEKRHPEAAELVKLRYFMGLTMQEAADALGMRKRSAEGLWEYSRAWLRRWIRTAREGS